MAKGPGSYIRVADERRIKLIAICAYCKKPGKVGIDHIVPVYKGGNSHPSNLTPCCIKCNVQKSVYTPDEWLVKLQKHVEEGRDVEYSKIVINSIINREYILHG